MKGILLLVAYGAVMLLATHIFARKGTASEDFHVGNRHMGTFSTAMSVAATWIWAPALFTSAEKAYTSGWPGLFWFLVPNVLCLLLFIPFAKRIRDRMPDGITLSGFMEKTYENRNVGRIYRIQLAALTLLSTTVQLLAGGKILASVTGLGFTATTVILALIAFSYSCISGIRASMLTDVIQMLFMLAACALFVPWAVASQGGLSCIIDGVGGITGEYLNLFDSKGIQVLMGFGLPTAIGLVSGPFGDQCFWQRAFSVDRERIGRSFSLGAAAFAMVPLSMGILGFIAAGSRYVASDTGVVNLEIVGNLFPSWATVPFLLMLVSGLLSTVDSNLCAAASLTTDLGITRSLSESGKEKLSHITMIALLAVSILIAHIPGLTVTHMFLFYGTLRATTLLPTVLTLLGRKLRPSGVVAGVAVALVTGLPVFAYATMNQISLLKSASSLYTVLVSGIIALAVTAAHRGCTTAREVS